jgi:hypothetical protein
MFCGHLDYFQKPPLEGRPNTKLGNHGTPNTHNRWFILFYHTWGPTWIEIHWNSIWLKARSHMTSYYNWGSMTTLHDFGGVLGQPWTFSFGLSQIHGHGSWLVCEVALRGFSRELNRRCVYWGCVTICTDCQRLLKSYYYMFYDIETIFCTITQKEEVKIKLIRQWGWDIHHKCFSHLSRFYDFTYPHDLSQITPSSI